MLSNVILKEERGVAGVKYRKALDDIVSYCMEYVKTKPKMFVNGFDYTIPIPGNLLSPFDFVEGLNMTIYLKSYVYGDRMSGSGNTQINQDDYITPDGKLKNIFINVYGYFYEDRIFTRTLLTSLYHEINHCIDFQSRKNNKSVIEVPLNTNEKYNVIFRESVFSYNQEVDTYFKQLFYRLFIPTERRALVSSVYGDLKSIDSKRTNFYKDILNTQAGKLLYDFSDNLDINIGYSSIESLKTCCQKLNVNGISFTEIGDFLSSFKRRVLEEIRKTWKDVGRAASLWYDEQEEFDVLKEGLIKIF